MDLEREPGLKAAAQLVVEQSMVSIQIDADLAALFRGRRDAASPPAYGLNFVFVRWTIQRLLERG